MGPVLDAQAPVTDGIISMSTGVALIIAATIILGALLGTLVSFCSVGAGALGVAVLFFLYPRLAPARVVGSDLAHAVPLTLAAGLGHWLIGGVDWRIVGSLLLGSLPGIFVGSHLAPLIADRILLPILAAILMLIGLRLIAS